VTRRGSANGTRQPSRRHRRARCQGQAGFGGRFARASRTLTAPLVDGRWPTCLFGDRSGQGPLGPPKRHVGKKPRRRDAVTPKAPKRSVGVAQRLDGVSAAWPPQQPILERFPVISRERSPDERFAFALRSNPDSGDAAFVWIASSLRSLAMTDAQNFGSAIPLARQAAISVLAISMAMVIGPTPPGTGVIAPARAAASP